MNGLLHRYFSVEMVLQLFCHKVKGANAILCVVQNNWKGNFSNFIDLQGKKDRFDRSFIILRKLLALYLAILYTWQLSNSY